MKTSGNLRRAERKVQHCCVGQWGGYLTTSEALSILDDGAQETNSVLYQRAHLEELKKKGDPGPSWFYFYPSKAQKQRWGK